MVVLYPDLLFYTLLVVEHRTCSIPVCCCGLHRKQGLRSMAAACMHPKVLLAVVQNNGVRVSRMKEKEVQRPEQERR